MSPSEPPPIATDSLVPDGLLPGWTCAVPGCGVFNGDVRERRTSCRGCGGARPPSLGSAAADAARGVVRRAIARGDAAREELSFLIHYLGDQDQDANHAWIVRRMRAVLDGQDPRSVQPSDQVRPRRGYVSRCPGVVCSGCGKVPVPAEPGCGTECAGEWVHAPDGGDTTRTGGLDGAAMDGALDRLRAATERLTTGYDRASRRKATAAALFAMVDKKSVSDRGEATFGEDEVADLAAFLRTLAEGSP